MNRQTRRKAEMEGGGREGGVLLKKSFLRTLLLTHSPHFIYPVTPLLPLKHKFNFEFPKPQNKLCHPPKYVLDSF